MTKTSRDVCLEALRHINVVALDEDAQAHEYQRAKLHLDSILTELDEIHEMAIQWTAETVPESHFLGLAMAVAGSIAPGFSKPEMASERSRGITLLRDIEFKSDDDSPVAAVYY